MYNIIITFNLIVELHDAMDSSTLSTRIIIVKILSLENCYHNNLLIHSDGDTDATPRIHSSVVCYCDFI